MTELSAAIMAVPEQHGTDDEGFVYTADASVPLIINEDGDRVQASPDDREGVVPAASLKSGNEPLANDVDKGSDVEEGVRSATESASDSNALHANGIDNSQLYDPIASMIDASADEAAKDDDPSRSPSSFGDKACNLWRKWTEEVKEQSKLGVPSSITHGARLVMSITDTAFLGHLGEKELAASSLGGFWLICTLYIGVGLTFAMDTLVSQAYGAGNLKLIGIYLQNSMVLSIFLAIPIGAMWWFTTDLLILCGVEASLAELSGIFVRYQLPSLYPFLVFRALLKYLENQGLTTPGMITNWVAAFSNVGLNYFLIFGGLGWKGLGFVGSPIATCISRSTTPLLLAAFVWARGLHKPTWSGWNFQEAFSPKRLWAFLKLGIPSCLMLSLEVAGFEATTALAGRLGQTVVAYHAIGMSVLLLSFIVPMGLGVGTATRVGNNLGAGSPNKARFSGFSGLLLCFACMLVNAVLMVVFRRPLAMVFTSDERIIEGAGPLLALAGVVTIVDGFQGVCASLLRGAGKPLPGTVFNILGLYVVSLSVGPVCTFVFGWGIYGLWFGLFLGLFTTSVLEFAYVFKIDWMAESRAARLRSEVALPSSAIVDEGMSDVDDDDASDMETAIEMAMMPKTKQKDDKENDEPKNA